MPFGVQYRALPEATFYFMHGSTRAFNSFYINCNAAEMPHIRWYRIYHVYGVFSLRRSL